MIAGLPVHWVVLDKENRRSPHMPAGLLGSDMVYVQGFDGSQPQHPMHARHVHWENVVAYALAHDTHDQPKHHHRAELEAEATVLGLSDDFYPGDGAE